MAGAALAGVEIARINPNTSGELAARLSSGLVPKLHHLHAGAAMGVLLAGASILISGRVDGS